MSPRPSTVPPAALFIAALLALCLLSTSPVAAEPIVSINAATRSDDTSLITGTTRTFRNTVPITGTSTPSRYVKYRYAKLFSYDIPVPPSALYSVSILLAETYARACKPGVRVFSITAHDAAKPPTKGKTVQDIDVFSRVGCNTALVISLNKIRVAASGTLRITFQATANNAFLNAMDISPFSLASPPPAPSSSPVTDPSPPPSPIPSPVSSPPATSPPPQSITVNVGGADSAYLPTSPVSIRRSSTSTPIADTANVMASNYRTARHATEFTYSFTLPPGKYDVLLGFAEFLPRFCSEPAKRVFHVYVNDLQQLESFDIFAEAGGACFKGVEKTLTFVSVDAVDTKPLTIRFEAVVNRALVNYIHIKPAPKSSGECIPASDTGSSGEFDHLAHSVPGTYPRQTGSNPVLSYVDTDGDGFHTVLIDGSGSHTHFSDSTKNIVGKITAYKWTNVDTDKVVSMRKSFRMKFPLGTTRLKLEVIDNACSVDMAETTVTVTGAIQPGMYCYYYDALSDDLVGGSAGSITSPRPQFSAIAAKASFGFPTFPFVNTLFATRCLFFLQSTRTARTSMVEIDTFGTGDARVYRGDDLILDSTGATSAETNLALGLTAFEIIYHRRTTDQAPKMKFLLEGRTPKGTRLQHDRRTVLPILSALSPGDGPNVGGTRVKISGYGLYRPLKVRFAGKRVKLLTGGSSTEATVITPPGTGTVKVTATGFSAVPSNALNFAYGSTCDSIRFTQTAMKKQNGDDVNLLLLATCAAVGHDGKIYVGTRGATVQVIDYDVTSLKVTSHCYSKSVVDKKYKLNGTPAVRDFLGITFDPRDSVLRPYLTSSTLFWHRREMIDFSNKEAWRNGAVDRLKPGTDPSDSKVCLVYDKRIVSGLPVSNTDHSVNSLLFTQDGNLLIAVGGFTNAGLPATSLGGYWETHFSAALLEAKLSKAGFDGSIIYNNVDPRLARKVSGDVDIYARGFRNPYAMTMAASGDVYLADMGPNCKKGDTAASCSDYDDVRNAAWDPNADGNVVWQGKVRHGGDPNNCPFGIEREDKIVHVIEGKFYGHPNIQRGGGECAWIDPRDGKTAEDKPAPSNYKGPIQMMQSPVTGLQDYRANHFCGKMRGNLVMSRFLGRKTHRMGVSEGRKTSSPDEISAGGGIVVVENAHGDLIMPKHNEGKVVVLRPRVTTSAVFFVAGAIPYRHGRSGGTKIVIGGGNFGSSPSVTIGGATCDIVSISNIEITCIVPAGSAGPKTLSVSSAGQTIDLPKAVLYMSV